MIKGGVEWSGGKTRAESNQACKRLLEMSSAAWGFGA